jgi:hypothetical protein
MGGNVVDRGLTDFIVAQLIADLTIHEEDLAASSSLRGFGRRLHGGAKTDACAGTSQ